MDLTGVRIRNRSEGTSYVLETELPGGGEGRIWKAWQVDPSGLRLPVAIKILDPDHYLGGQTDVDTVLELWRRQAQVLRSFGHDGFVPVQVVFRISAPSGSSDEIPAWMAGRPAFVLAWVDGPNLKLWSPAVSDPVERLRILQRCAAGLDAFHRETRHVHRDLKPSNVVVDGDRARIIDFGLVRSFEQQRDGSLLAGTIGYLAPELFAGAQYSPATDLYAFAGILFYQLTGEDPPAAVNNKARRIQAAISEAGFPRLAPLMAGALHDDQGGRPTISGAQDLLDRLVESATAHIRIRLRVQAGASSLPDVTREDAPSQPDLVTKRNSARTQMEVPDERGPRAPDAVQVLRVAVAFFIVVLLALLVIRELTS